MCCATCSKWGRQSWRWLQSWQNQGWVGTPGLTVPSCQSVGPVHLLSSPMERYIPWSIHLWFKIFDQWAGLYSLHAWGNINVVLNPSIPPMIYLSQNYCFHTVFISIAPFSSRHLECLSSEKWSVCHAPTVIVDCKLQLPGLLVLSQIVLLRVWMLELILEITFYFYHD